MGAWVVGCSSANHGNASPADSGAVEGADASVADGADSGVVSDASADAGPTVIPVPLPNGDPGIGFDDLRYAPVLKKVLAPAGRTGNLDLVDPSTLEVTAIGGFTASTTFTAGRHRSGTTSADEGGGKLFAIDNETKSVRVADPATKSILFSTTLGGAPDIVRWVQSTGEIWVTQPNNPGITPSANPGIEVLTVPAGGAPVSVAMIPVPGTGTGPESIVVDNTRSRVYTNSAMGQTYAIDVTQRAIVETWANGCTGLTVGLALDEARGFVFATCQVGRVAVLDVAHGGAKLGEISTGSGLDIISYSASLHHLYLAGATSADLAIAGVSAAGVPTLLGTVPTAQGSQQVTSDDEGNVWVGDPAGGRLLKVRDTYPATP
jgi:hypothetical protein